MELWSVKRRNLIQQAIDEFQEDVAQVFANPRWRYYSDMSLKRYDQFEALRQAAQRLEKAYGDSVALAREAQNYCEAVARDFRQSASDLVSPSQFGNEILIFDREVEAKINLARKPDDVVAAFKEGTTYTTNKAQRYAWIRNMDKALRRIEELTQSTEGPSFFPETQEQRIDAQNRTLRTITTKRAELEQLSEAAFAETFPKYADLVSRAEQYEEELHKNTDDKLGFDRLLLQNAVKGAAADASTWWAEGVTDDGSVTNPLLDEFAAEFGKHLAEGA